MRTEPNTEKKGRPMDATQNGYPAVPGPAPAPPTADHALIETVWRRLRAVAATHAAHHGLAAGDPSPPDREIADLLWWTAAMPGRPPTALLRLPAGRPVPTDIKTREAAGTVWAEATDADAVLRILSSVYLGNLEHRSAGWRRPDADGARPPIDEARIPLPAADGEDPVSAGSSVEIRTVPTSTARCRAHLATSSCLRSDGPVTEQSSASNMAARPGCVPRTGPWRRETTRPRRRKQAARTANRLPISRTGCTARHDGP